ncbi:MAG: YqhA family protein [Anaerolineae bacterium]|jgi:uncharacterized membrane protein YqhA
MSEPENVDKRLPFWARIMASTRYVMGLAVLGIFVGSTALLISGSVDMFTAVWRALSGTADYSEGLRVTLIESVDTVLVSTVLYMIAIGLYQLFIDPSLILPRWIHTQGLGDLEKRLAGMVVTVLSVIFVTVALESHGTKDILPFGLAIASVIAAVSLFLYQEAKHHQGHDSAED